MSPFGVRSRVILVLLVITGGIGQVAPSVHRLVSASAPTRVPQLSAVTIALSPARSHVILSEILTLDLKVSSRSQPVGGVVVRLSCDPAILRVVDAQGVQTDRISPGTALPAVLANSADNAAGLISYEAGMDLGGMPVGGEFVLATLHVKAIATTPEAGTVIHFGAGTSMYDGAGNPMPASWEDGIVVVARDYRVYLPLLLK